MTNPTTRIAAAPEAARSAWGRAGTSFPDFTDTEVERVADSVARFFR